MQETVLLEDLEIYKLSIEIGEDVWSIVDKWDYFAKKTIGTQIVDAADSISANIAEDMDVFSIRTESNFATIAEAL